MGSLSSMRRIELPGDDIVGLRADNPGPFSLDGTNSWIVGRDPAWLIDPGPALTAHIDALVAELEARGGLGTILLTHDHHDHRGALPALSARLGPVPVAASPRSSESRATLRLTDGDRLGPLAVVATPGHAPDHLAYRTDDGVVFSGDAVLGAGSVFVAPDPGALRAYLRALERLRATRPRLIAPGHGPLVSDAEAKLTEYLAHRRDRERALLQALAEGARTIDQLLARAWADVPAVLRGAAAVTLAAHLDKLEDEGRLPAGVERPPWPLDWPEV